MVNSGGSLHVEERAGGGVMLASEPRAAAFPENEVQVLPDYLSPALHSLFAALAQGLKGAMIEIEGDVQGPEGELAGTVLAARGDLLAFVRSLVLQRGLQLMKDIGDAFQSREWGIALTKIAELEQTSGIPPVDDVTVTTALREEPIRFVEIRERPTGIPTSVNRTLPGYRGKRPSNMEVGQLLAVHSLLSRGMESRWQVGLLRAEAQFAQRAFVPAISGFSGLLAPAAAFPPHRVRFAAIRAAFAHLARGDEIYAGFRVLTPADKAAGLAEYKAAVHVVAAAGVSEQNPLRMQIEAYAAARTDQLEAGFNILAFKDAYVPIFQPEFLASRAEAWISETRTAVKNFLDFRLLASQLTEQQAQARIDNEVASLGQAIARERIGTADEKVNVADSRAEKLQEALDSLLKDTAISAIPVGLKAAFAKQNPAAVAAEGIATTVMGYLARKNELENQLEMAQVEQRLARREKGIAELERAILATRQRSLAEQIRHRDNRLLNANLFYALANLYEDLANRSLEVAIRWAYLYERAVGYKRLKRDLQIIRLEYRQQSGEVSTFVPAPDLLKADLQLVRDQDVPATQGQILVENPISLRSRYPIEFNRFLESSRMDFAISLYDLDRRRPGVYERRLEAVQVQVVGLVPVTGFSGRIIHHGAFTLRDKQSTLAAHRLVPTPEEMAKAAEQLEAGQTQADPIGGVVAFLLGDQRQELSAVATPGDPRHDATALALFDGYGETGRWTLEINDGVELSQLSDVLLTFRIRFPESDAGLAAHVKSLVEAYERELIGEDELDRTVAFSLRRRFPDAFADLATGSARFTIDDELVPDADPLKVKAVVGQLVDDESKGIEGATVEIAAVGTAFAITRVTEADGFTEQADKEIPRVPRPDRVPIQGQWEVRVHKSAQQPAVGDLRLFFVHELSPREA